MKKALIGFSLVTVLGGSLAYGRVRAFQNLDFESAHVVFTEPGSATIATTNALPGWTAFDLKQVGGITFTQQLNSIHFGFAFPVNPPVALIPPASGTTVRATIDGDFSVLLRSGGGISQTGEVPADTQALLFKVYSDSILGGSVLASLDGQNLPLVKLLTAPNTSRNIGYTLYGASVSGFAGHPADLVFSGTGALLDDIEFSPQPVPEPLTIVLLLLAGGVFACCRQQVGHGCGTSGG